MRSCGGAYIGVRPAPQVLVGGRAVAAEGRHQVGKIPISEVAKYQRIAKGGECPRSADLAASVDVAGENSNCRVEQRRITTSAVTVRLHLAELDPHEVDPARVR